MKFKEVDLKKPTSSPCSGEVDRRLTTAVMTVGTMVDIFLYGVIASLIEDIGKKKNPIYYN